MRIETNKLETLFQQVVDKLKELGIDSIEVNTDYYLLISSDDWEKVDKDNPEPTMGSLVDDWTSLSKVASGANPMTFVDFDRLSSILRAISEKLNSQKKSIL